MARISNIKQKRFGNKTIAIIADGKTELWYLQMLKKNEGLNTISLKPELPKKKSLEEQFKKVEESANIFDKVIWIVDWDSLIKEERETKKGKPSPTQKFNSYRSKIDSDTTFIDTHILVNTPCLEFWFLLHFENTSKFFQKCDKAEDQLKKHLVDFKKTEKYFKNSSNDIYKRLIHKKDLAIRNAKNLGDFDSNNPNKALSEFHKIFELLEVRFNAID